MTIPSKEDILNKADLIFYCATVDTVEGDKGTIFKAMDEYAKQIAIGFADWTAKNRWTWIDYGEGFWCDESENEWMGERSRLVKSEQLFNQYLNTLIQ